MTWRVWVLIAAICAILIAPWLYDISRRRGVAPPEYPPMCFIASSVEELSGYSPATWIERNGIQHLVQRFVIFDCLDGRQFVVPWVKRGGVEKKDTR